MNITFEKIETNFPYNLLLIADETIELINKYLLKNQKAIIVGTGDAGFKQINFYKKNGYSQYAAKKNFFLDNFSEPIFEDGIMLKDMIMLKKEI